MTNKNFMIFQTAVSKYLGIHKKVKVAILIVFIHRFPKIDEKLF
jgi:hypothetical protein